MLVFFVFRLLDNMDQYRVYFMQGREQQTRGTSKGATPVN
jgi:hypothetical protein